jgi:periplasmic protein TonB
MNSFIAVTTLIALSLFLNNEPAQSLEKQAVSDTQRTLASDLDAELPKLPFTDWFVKLVGPGAGVVWQLSECGEQVDAAPNGDGDTQACVEVNTILSDGRKVIVMITVGTFKKGVTGPPAFRFGVIEQKGKLRPIRRLSDLQNLLSGQGEMANSPAAKLPEMSMPSVRLAPNNAYSTGTPLLTGEDFVQLMPIEAPEPPPPSPPPPSPPPVAPPRTMPATSNSTSNTERRDAPDGVRQGAPTFKPQPKYPQNARRFNASGKVEVRVTISVTGRVTKATAISGHPLLRDAAVEAARRWEFEPTVVNGTLVETELVLTFEFATPPPP